MTDQQAIDALEKTITRTSTHSGELLPSPMFGPMDKETLLKVTLLHAEHLRWPMQETGSTSGSEAQYYTIELVSATTAGISFSVIRTLSSITELAIGACSVCWGDGIAGLGRFEIFGANETAEFTLKLATVAPPDGAP